MALRAIDPASLFTYTQPDPTWYFNASGVLVKETTPDTLVLDHKYEGSAWVPRGQPVFPEVENLCTRSNALSTNININYTGWLKKGGRIATPQPSSVTGPDGNASLWWLLAPDGGGDRVLRWKIETPTDGVFTAQGIASAVPGNAATHMNCYVGGAGWCYLDLSAGTWTLAAGVTAGAEAIGDSGLWFFWISADVVLSGGDMEHRFGPAQGETTTAAANDEIAFGWVVIHRHPFPVPYVEANDGTPVVRSVDNLKTDAATARWFVRDRWTMFVDVELAKVVESRRLIQLAVGGNDRVSLLVNNNGEVYGYSKGGDAGSGATLGPVTTAVASRDVKAALTRMGDGQAQVIQSDEGIVYGPDGDKINSFQGILPNLFFGSYLGTSASLCGWMKRARVVPRDLSSTELEALVA